MSDSKVIAIAGGTGGLGRHIVEELITQKKHKVVVLSRTPQPAFESLGCDVRQVDYTSHTSLVSALTGVHTLISCVAPLGPELSTTQIQMIRAAEEAGVKRFAPSEWAGDTKKNKHIVLYREKMKVIDVLRKSRLEWTLFMIGIFMNYFASSTASVGHLHPLKFIVDVENGTANIPGTGDEPLIFTAVEDVAKFVAAALDLPKWEARSGMAGETMEIKPSLVVTGRKFTVRHHTAAFLQSQLKLNPSSLLDNFYVEVCLAIMDGDNLAYETTLNDALLEVKPVGVEAFMEKWWRK
ncbi:hypothetical protein HK104_001435 [Borealophlyctis nickersoniae]|nr:hypothetical protein HK104_001435 [Borealophlyctis nickersoniae]